MVEKIYWRRGVHFDFVEPGRKRRRAAGQAHIAAQKTVIDDPPQSML